MEKKIKKKQRKQQHQLEQEAAGVAKPDSQAEPAIVKPATQEEPAGMCVGQESKRNLELARKGQLWKRVANQCRNS